MAEFWDTEDSERAGVVLGEKAGSSAEEFDGCTAAVVGKAMGAGVTVGPDSSKGPAVGVREGAGV